MSGPWQHAGYDSVARDGTTNSLPVRVLVPVDKDSWRMSDDDYDALRIQCAATVAEALNRAEPYMMAIPREFAAELIAAITDLRECDTNPMLTAANARAQRLAMTLAELLEMKP